MGRFGACAWIAVAGAVASAGSALAHELEPGRWSPLTGGPRLNVSAADVLQHAPPPQVVPELPLDERPEFRFVDLERLGGAPTQGRAALHRAGGRRVARAEGPVATLTRADTGFAAAEPTLGVTGDGTLFYVGLQAGQHVLLRSRDEGVTWERLDPAIPGQQREELTFDPFIWVDPVTDRLWDADLTTPSCATISASDDGGETFSASLNCNHTDHQNLYAGPAPAGGAQPTGHPHVAYYCSNDGGATLEALGTGCSKSLDGGLTWIRTGSLAFQNDPTRTGGSFGIPGFCSGATGHVAVGPDGTVYVPRGWCDQPYVAISRDEGATWTRVQVADLGVVVGIEDEVIGTAAGLAVEDHEASIAADPAGNLYYLWIAADHLPYLVVSRDGGATWGKPVMVAPPGVNEAWGPTIDAGDTGRIAFAYIGTTNSPGGPYCARTTSTTTCETADGSPATPASAYEGTTWHGYMGMSVDALAERPTFQSASVSTPADPIDAGPGCGPVRCLAQLDFIDVVVARDGTAWASFVDACDGDACGGQGMGIVGRMIGGPPLVGSSDEQRPPVSAPPGSRPCTPARRLQVRVRPPRRGRLKSVRARAGGRRLKVIRRGRGAVIRLDLRRFRGSTVTLRIVTRTSTGRRFRTVRRYRVC